MISDCWNVSRRRKCGKYAAIRAREKNARCKLPRRGDRYAISRLLDSRTASKRRVFAYTDVRIGRLSRDSALSSMFPMETLKILGWRKCAVILSGPFVRRALSPDPRKWSLQHDDVEAHFIEPVTKLLLYAVDTIFIFLHYLSSLTAMPKVLSRCAWDLGYAIHEMILDCGEHILNAFENNFI